MITLEKLTYDILSTVAGTSRISDDIGIDEALIKYKIINTRALLIRQDATKGRSTSDNVEQILN